MLYHKSFAFTFLLVTCISSYAFTHTLPSFFNGNFEELCETAKATDKPFVVYFANLQSPLCQKMDQESWIDPELIDFADKNYLLYRSDPLALKEIWLADRYNIRQVPSIALFSPDGELLSLMEGYQSAKQLLEALESHYFHLDDPLKVVYTSNSENHAEGYQALQTRSQTRPSPTHSTRGQAQTPKVIPSSRPRTVQTRSRTHSLTEVGLEVKGFIEFSPKKLLQEEREAHLGILIGNFSTLERLQEEVVRFKRIWKKDLWVYQEKVLGSLYFRLVLGTFETSDEVEIYENLIHSLEHINTEMIDLGKIVR